MALYRSFLTVGFFTIFSRVIGFLREVLTATLLGAGASSDALKVAIKLPSLFRRIFAEGAFNAAFVPMFAAQLEQSNGKEEARNFAEQILTWLVLILLGLVIIVELFLPSIFPLLAPGFKETPERLELAIQFTRVTFPFIFLISLTAFYSGILNSIDRFAIAASSPMVGNVFIVLFTWWCAQSFSNPGFAFAWAIVGCGVVQLLWVMLPSIRHGFSLKLHYPKLLPKTGEFLKKVLPAAFGAGVVQMNLLIDTIIASYLPTGGMSYLDYADRLNQLPLSVIGTAIATALLPLMSKQISLGKRHEAQASQEHSIEFAMLLTLPAMAGLIIWAGPLVEMVFQHGKFTAADTRATSHALMAYASGLPAYILIKIFSTTFFAHHDTKTPIIIAMGAMALNLVLNLSLIGPLGHIGLALATSISAWVNAFVLIIMLRKQDYLVLSEALLRFCGRMIGSLALALPVLILLRPWLEVFIEGSFGWKVLCMTLVLVGGVSLFLITSWLTGALDFKRFKMQIWGPKYTKE